MASKAKEELQEEAIQADLTNPGHVDSLIQQMEAQVLSLNAQLVILKQLKEDLGNDSPQPTGK